MAITSGWGSENPGSIPGSPTMKFSLNLASTTILSFLRESGYSPEGTDEKTGELRFARPLRGARYPRFHLYCTKEGRCALHLDQKQPSYNGTSAHSGEYNGPLVEQEVTRLNSPAPAL